MAAPKTDESGIRQTLRALQNAGYTLRTVWDGEEEISVATEREALAAITDVADAILYVVRGPGEGWVRFVLGNEPFEVICDHTEGLEPVLDPLMRSWGAY